MNNFTRVTTACLLASASLVPALAKQTDNDKKLDLETCYVNGVTRDATCGFAELPLNYNKPEGDKVSVHVMVISARKTEKEADPLFILAGGPGQAAGEYGALVKLAFSQVRGKRDIVLIDQRGTGQSYGMMCSSDDSVETMAESLEAIAECRKGFKLDTRHFTMANVIQDMDEIRAQLGYETINLWGASYGTRTADAYVKTYPERVRSMVLDGILPPDISLFETAPKSAQRALDKIVEECAAQEACQKNFPEFKEQVFALMAKAERGELRYQGINPVSGEYVDMLIEMPFAVESLRSVMYGADGTTRLPFAVNEASKGNLLPMFGPMFANAGAGMYIGATLSMLCGDEVSRVDAEKAKAAGEGSFAGDSYYQLWSQMCTKWDYEVPSSDYKAAVNTDIPTLILSGNLDPITPPEMGDHYMKGVTNGRHIVVNGTGHNTSYTGCVPDLINQFITDLDAEVLDDSCLSHIKRLPIIIGVNGNVQ